ncbi:MAG: ABC transporter substrate-binding protein [Planctomycetota bacterium]|nr:ABC transporter substrate-binding protein [Planctomycetota bacterium]
MPETIHVGHSPDPDDAFMFYALTFAKFDTTPESYEHHLIDIETLNQKALKGEYEVTALSFHAYTYVADKYALLPHGASLGDGYGPMIVAKRFEGGDPKAWLAGKKIAVPGIRTSAFLSLNLYARGLKSLKSPPVPFTYEVVPFDAIIPEVAAGRFDGGLIIHEGQLTYHEETSGRLAKVVDLGEWWKAETGLPLPLGGNGIRKDLGKDRIPRISRHLHDSIKWGLDHRKEALQYALRYARDMGEDKADKFVGMYVNDYTLDYGAKGREAIRRFLDAGYEAGVLTVKPVVEFAV